MQEQEEIRPSDSKGSLLWIPYKLFKPISRFVSRHRVVMIIGLVIVAIGLLVMRSYIQPYVLILRRLSLEIILGTVFLGSLYFLYRKGHKFKTILILVFVIGVGFMIEKSGSQPHYYQTLFFQFKTLDKEALDEMPETRFERIHPLHSIHTATNARIGDTQHTTVPDYVSYGDGDPHWTVGIEPAYPHQRVFGQVERIFSLPGQNHLLDFSGERQVEVLFDSGENMKFVKNTSFMTRQGFGPLRFLSYSPSNMKYIPGPDGQIVQCVTLIKWKGIIFPKPHFGGVVIFNQGEMGIGDYTKRLLIGEGKWIKPSEIGDYEWLKGQNLVPYEVSRHVAHSFRFRYGYFAPFPLTHYKDIRIPDLAGDMNEQPFTMYFKFDEGDSDRNKLYHYFALEPYKGENRNKTGLAISVLCPADGIGPIYYYEHAEKYENLAGVSTISTYIKEKKREYDWSQSKVAEHRPYIRTIDGEKMLFWLSTVVTKTDDGSGFTAGSSIDVFLTSTKLVQPVQVPPGKPEEWVEKVKSELLSGEID